MNIWLVNHHANPPHEPGDARHYSHARELMRRGHDVRVVACNFDHIRHKHLPIATGRTWENDELQGVPFTMIAACAYDTNFEVARIRNMFEFALRARKLDWAYGLAAPNLVLGSTPDPFAALAAERIAAHYGVPFLLEVRDAWPFVFTEIGNISPHHPFVVLVDKVMRYLYKRAARIIMFSRNSRDLLVRYGAAPDKIVWISHGVDLSFNPEPRPRTNDGQFTITYLGAHNTWNSLDAVLDAAKIVQRSGASNITFRFVGDGESKPALVSRVASEGIANVRFDDPVPKSQVTEVKHNSDAFIINNRPDAVSKHWMSFNKLFDYMSAGRPVVFGTHTDNNPVLESGGGISVEADNIEELARGVLSLAKLPADELREMGMRGRRHITEHYSIPKLVDRFEQVAIESLGREVVSRAGCAPIGECQ